MFLKSWTQEWEVERQHTLLLLSSLFHEPYVTVCLAGLEMGTEYEVLP